jgi:hypothetical protein
LFQNPVGFGQALGKTGQKPGFSTKFKEAVPKTEVLEQPLLSRFLEKLYRWTAETAIDYPLKINGLFHDFS